MSIFTIKKLKKKINFNLNEIKKYQQLISEQDEQIEKNKNLIQSLKHQIEEKRSQKIQVVKIEQVEKEVGELNSLNILQDYLQKHEDEDLNNIIYEYDMYRDKFNKYYSEQKENVLNQVSLITVV